MSKIFVFFKPSIQFLSKILVFTFLIALISGFLHPTVSKASITTSSLDSAPVNLTVQGDCKNVLTINATNLPELPVGEYYWAAVYDSDTGEFFGYGTFSPDSTGYNVGVYLSKFVPVGKNNYQVVLTKGAGFNPNVAPNIIGVTSAIGKSQPFTCERTPVTVTLSTPQSYLGMDGTPLNWKMNQSLNGDSDVYIFNITTGGLEGMSLGSEGHSGGMEGRLESINFPYGQQYQYQAFALSIPRYMYFTPGITRMSEIDPSKVIAVSNIITLERKPWSIELKESNVTGGNLQINYTAVGGGREYATYVVDNETKDIIWDSPANNSPYNGDDIPNPEGKDTSRFTAYIARSYLEVANSWIYSRWYSFSSYNPTYYNYPWDSTTQKYVKPTKLDDLKDIIASSDGYIQQPSGVTDPQQVAGGKNPSEPCSQCSHGDPINTATGEFYDTKSDITTLGSGLVPMVERSFSTINKDKLNLLGYGWRTNYEMKIVVDSTKDTQNDILSSRFLSIENENGSISSFYRNSTNSFIGASKTQAVLIWDNSTQTFTYSRKDKVDYIFNSTGQLIKIKNGSTQVVLNYLNDRLNTVTGASGSVLTFSYNSTGLVQTITDQNGRVVTYSYDANSQLSDIVNAKGVSYTYTYDSEKRIDTLTNELGGITTNTYNSNNQTIKQIDPLGRVLTFEYSGNLMEGTTKITYPNNKVIEEFYNNGQIKKKIENYGQTNARTWEYSYDAGNNRISTLNTDSTSISMRYDVHGNMIVSTDENGNATTFTYDSRNNLLTIADPNNNITTNTYDSNDNLISSKNTLGEKTSFTYNEDKSLASTTDARGNSSTANPYDYTSAFSYLPNGLVSTITNSIGGVTSMTYNSSGNVTETENPNGNKTQMEYNTLGLPIKVTDPLQNQTATSYDQMGNVLTSTNAKGAVTTYTYDLVGNRLTVNNALNQTITYTYNSTNKPVTITLADGTVQTITYDIFDRPTDLKDQLLRVTKQEWDSNSRLTASIDPDGGRTEYTYDSAGNLKTMKTPRGAITSYFYDKMNRPTKITDALGRSTFTEYDANGKVTKTTAADGTNTENIYDAVGNVIQTKNETGAAKTYTYDSLSRKVSSTNELGQTTTYAYDAASNLISQTRPDNSVVGYTYDVRNLLLSIDYPGTAEDIAYTYDELGRKITEKKGTDATVTYSYDSLNRVISRGTDTSKVSYSYDSVGNLLNLTYPSGRVVAYGYDAASQLVQLNSDGIGTNTFNYNNRSLQTSAALANGVTESRIYDADSQLISTELLDGANSLYKRAQSYNLGGEVVQRGSAMNGASLTLENFAYNPVSRLTQHTSDGSGQNLNNYGYNSVGNLITVDNTAQTYDAAGKITDTGSASVSYDSRNNRTALMDTNASKNAEYTWAQNNLLTSVTTHEGTSPKTVSYTYGADSLLESRVEGSSTDQFVWDSSRKIPAMLSDGKYEYIYSNDRTPLAQVEILTGTVTYLHYDLTGSVTASTNTNGGLVGTVDYSPYGVATGSLLSSFGYAGEWTDATTGYSYLKARWLDAQTGTFLSEDPMVQMTNNAFGYTEGNPITQIDPLGLVAFEVFKIGLKMVGNTLNDTGKWISENPDHVSAILSGVALATAFIPGAQPISLLASAGSVAFGAIATKNEIDKCTAEDTKDCNPGMVTLSAISTATGGFGLLGRGAIAATRLGMTNLATNKSLKLVEDLEGLGLVATAESELMWGISLSLKYDGRCSGS